jgi:hypothetical protein
LERKRLLDYGGSGDLDEIDAKNESKNKMTSDQANHPQSSTTAVLASSSNNDSKKKAAFQLKNDDEEDEDDDFDSEPWDHKRPGDKLTGAKQPDRRELDAGKLENQHGKNAKAGFDDSGNEDWDLEEPKPKAGQAAALQKGPQKENQLSLGDLLKHQNEAKKPVEKNRNEDNDNGLIVDDDFADEFEEDEDDGELEGLLDDKEIEKQPSP